MYGKSINYLKPDTIKNKILQYNYNYKQHTKRKTEEIFSINDVSRFSKEVNKAVLSEGFKNNVTLAAVSLFNKLFDRNKTFGELFDGRLKIYIDKNLPRILKNITQKIKDNLAESKTIVSTALRAEFKNQLGFFESGLYAIMDGDTIIDHIEMCIRDRILIMIQINKFNNYICFFSNLAVYFYGTTVSFNQCLCNCKPNAGSSGLTIP